MLAMERVSTSWGTLEEDGRMGGAPPPNL